MTYSTLGRWELRRLVKAGRVGTLLWRAGATDEEMKEALEARDKIHPWRRLLRERTAK